MCGIAGMAGRPDAALVRRMTDTLAHRGPDAEGFFDDDGAALGHRRLSIIDLDAGGQPMRSQDGRFVIVYNGELYNFRALRAELSARGHVFRTASDTEVLLAAFEAWGIDALPRLQGMFAFAVWDTRERTLTLARDPVGVKPLYYAMAGDRLYFASEMKAILACPEISRETDFAALDDYLAFLHTVPPRTFYRAIRQLPPAHAAQWREGAWSERRYWRLRIAPEARGEADWIDALDAALRSTVERQMVSDVPLGAFLSGGLDSASIVYAMTQVQPRPHTFTIGFDAAGALYDEAPEARALAARLGTDHHELTVRADVAQLLPALVRHFDEPFGNPTALLTYRLCELVRRHVAVILSGDGGDECFGGYPRYAGVRLAERWRRVPRVLRALADPLVQALPESTRGAHTLRRLREFSAGSLRDPVSMYVSWLTHCTAAERAALYTPGTARAVGGHAAEERLHALAREADTDDPAARAMYIDLHSFLPNNVLQYGDRMSMAHGLEARVPLADHTLFELMARVPPDFKLRGRQSKYLLRRWLEQRLPREIAQRPKRGFNPPMGVWIGGELRALVEDHLSEAALRRRGLFEPARVRTMLAEHRAGRRDHTWRIWALVVLEAWWRQYLD